MSSESLHVPRDKLSASARLLHYAITSIQEEFDAVDWYRQRADDTEDEDLKQILLHNMREEMEHACMLLEWLRRKNSDFDGYVRTYFFSNGPLTNVEQKAEHGGETGDAEERKTDKPPRAPRLTIGDLKGE